MFHFLDKINFLSSKYICFFISIFYGFNCFTIANLGAVGLNIVYAFLPLVVLYTINLLSCTKNYFLINSIRLALSLAVVNLAVSQGFILALFLSVFYVILILLFSHFRCDNFKKILIYFTFAIFLFFLLTLEINLHYLELFFNNGAAGIMEGVKNSYYKTFFSWSWFADYYPLAISPFTFLINVGIKSKILSILGLVILLFTFSTTLINSDSKVKKYFLINLFIVLFYSFFILLIQKNNILANAFFNKIFILKAFSEPYKWGYILSLPVCLILGLSVTSFLNYFKKRKIFKVVFSSIFFIALFIGPVYSLILKKESFNSKPISGQGGTHQVSIRIPTYYEEINGFVRDLRDSGDFSRILWLPSENNLHSFKGNDQYSFVFPPNNYKLTNYFARTFEQLENNSGHSKILKLFDIRYVIILKQIKQPWEPTAWVFQGMPQYIVGRPESFIEYYNSMNGVVVYRETEDYLIYRIL